MENVKPWKEERVEKAPRTPVEGHRRPGAGVLRVLGRVKKMPRSFKRYWSRKLPILEKDKAIWFQEA